MTNESEALVPDSAVAAVQHSLPEGLAAVAAVQEDQAQAPAAKARVVLTDRAAILAANDLRIKEVPVPEWGGPGAVVLVRNLTAEGRGMFIQRTIDIAREAEVQAELARHEGKEPPKFDDDRNTEAFLVAMTVCDEQGNLVFTPEDVAALTKKSAAPIMRVASVAQGLSALTKEAQENAVKP